MNSQLGLNKSSLNNRRMHAHFDCFSGAAGDMMLAACIDASDDPEAFLHELTSILKTTLPEDEFELSTTRVLRGSGRIGGRHLNVRSIYEHAAAPVPPQLNAGEHRHEHTSHEKHHNHAHKNNHVQANGHGHAPKNNHVHANGYDHSHDHGDSHDHDHSSNHNHDYSDECLSKDFPEKNHNDAHEHDHDHNNSHDHDHGHSHGHDHGHSHGHSSSSDHGWPLRNLPQIRRLIYSESSKLPDVVKRVSIKAFEALARAEAHTHNSSIDRVHFHEVGAVDSLVDTIGTVLALFLLGVDLGDCETGAGDAAVSISALPMGDGTVWTDHGRLPVPAPAALHLMVGMAVCPGPTSSPQKKTTSGELVTPTAAALLNVLTDGGRRSGPGSCPPIMRIRSVGVGAGTKDFRNGHPNILRLVLGELGGGAGVEKDSYPNLPLNIHTSHTTTNKNSITVVPYPSSSASTDKHLDISSLFPPGAVQQHRMVQLEANLDDVTPEVLAYTASQLLSHTDAVDVWIQPIVMKKGRAAHILCVLSHDDTSALRDILRIIYQETTTLGVRIHRDIDRIALHRSYVSVNPFPVEEKNSTTITRKVVDVKVGHYYTADDERKQVVTVSPEYEHCRSVAEDRNKPLKVVMDEAKRVAKRDLGL